MGYAILRMAKIKHVSKMRRSLAHAFREQDTPNADSERTPDNSHMGAASVDEALDKFDALLPAKRRSDAVLAVEYLVTGSPESVNGMSRQQQDAYLADALKWIQDRHGAANVVYAGIHRDESTPHLYAYVVPLDPESGRLNAKRWFGGAKALSEMQTDFAERVGKAHGLERGIEGSKATHQRVSEHYAQIVREPVTPTVNVPEPTLAERVNQRAYGERVARETIAQLEPQRRVLQAKANEAESERKRRQEVEATAKAQRRDVQRLKTWAKPLQEYAQAAGMAEAQKAAQALHKAAEDAKARKAQERTPERPRTPPTGQEPSR